MRKDKELRRRCVSEWMNACAGVSVGVDVGVERYHDYPRSKKNSILL